MHACVSPPAEAAESDRPFGSPLRPIQLHAARASNGPRAMGLGCWKFTLPNRFRFKTLGPAGPQRTRIVDLGQGWPPGLIPPTTSRALPEDPSKPSEPIPKHILDFIFVRELSEVYLLMDHVSGRWDKCITDTDLVKSVCEISWPPTGTPVEQAAQASALLSAKDKLNRSAKPASGATIAFTLLVAGEDSVDHRRRGSLLFSLWRKMRRQIGRSRRLRGDDARGLTSDGSLAPPSPPRPALSAPQTGAPPSRLSLARLAFPGLVRPAKWFKWEIRIIIMLLLLWLMATCLLSWDVAAGHAIYVRVDALRVQESEYGAKIKGIEADAAKRDTPSTRMPDIGLFLEQNCRAARLVTPPSRSGDNVEPFRTVDELRLCNEMSRSRAEFAVSHQDLAEWLADWKYWLSAVAGELCRHTCLPVPASTAPVTEAQTNEQWGAILLEVLATAVLPLCYGLLGAGAAVVRDLWGKMKDSLLSPRDLTLALGQLALGAVVGACIGLFVSPSGNSAQGTSGLLGSVVLSASALSFVAGFGVEGVFVALESLIKRVFNIPQAAQPT
jgi:hypothetical protein